MAEVALKELSVDSSVRVLEKLREKWVRDQKPYQKWVVWFFSVLHTIKP